jgi:hypothetical protein
MVNERVGLSCLWRSPSLNFLPATATAKVKQNYLFMIAGIELVNVSIR